jgi:hypothetical protein
MTISWREVLQIETFLTNYAKEKYSEFERLLWRHPETINTALRVDKYKQYSIEDLLNYLTSKFPEDPMIKKGREVIKELFEGVADGKRICKIDEELFDINQNQEAYKLSDDILKRNLFNICSEYTGSTSFFLYGLKSVIDSKRDYYKDLILTEGLREEITQSFLEHYKNQFEDLQQEIFIMNAFHKLRDQIKIFMTDSRFTSFVKSCEKNNYIPPYLSSDFERFLNDVLNFSINEVIEIINTKTENYFSFKLRNNESPYPEDLRKSNYGNLNIFVTLYGLIHFDKIVELKLNGELLSYIKKMLSIDHIQEVLLSIEFTKKILEFSEFTILPRESINDDYNSDVTVRGNRMNSSLIIGKDLIQRNLYNQYIDDYHEKVICGFVWYNDDIQGITYRYLEFSDESDNKGEYSNSIPFENVIFKYLIAYLNKSRWERQMEDDLKNEGYWYSREQYQRETSSEYDEEDDIYNSFCVICKAEPGEFCKISDHPNYPYHDCPYGREN